MHHVNSVLYNAYIFFPIIGLMICIHESHILLGALATELNLKLYFRKLCIILN